MRAKTAAAGITVATTAFVTSLAPAAQAGTATPGAIKVCVLGSGDLNSRVEIDRMGSGPNRASSTDGCVTFRRLQSGRYHVDVDPPAGWHVTNGDQNRIVRVQKNHVTHVTYRIAT